jgi:hypothetical protein
MLSKIKELLGEELSKQVEEKIGSIELGIVNDGSLVPADKHDMLKIEHKELQKKYTDDTSSLNVELKKAIDGNTDVETLKIQLEKIKTDSETKVNELTGELTKTKKNGVLNAKLIEKNIDKNYLDMVKSQIDLEKLVIDGDGILGIDELINNTITKYPKMFGEIKKVGEKQNQNLNDPIPTDKQKLIDKYNEVESNADMNPNFKAREMGKLDAQIRAIK